MKTMFNSWQRSFVLAKFLALVLVGSPLLFSSVSVQAQASDSAAISVPSTDSELIDKFAFSRSGAFEAIFRNRQLFDALEFSESQREEIYGRFREANEKHREKINDHLKTRRSDFTEEEAIEFTQRYQELAYALHKMKVSVLREIMPPTQFDRLRRLADWEVFFKFKRFGSIFYIPAIQEELGMDKGKEKEFQKKLEEIEKKYREEQLKLRSKYIADTLRTLSDAERKKFIEIYGDPREALDLRDENGDLGIFR